MRSGTLPTPLVVGLGAACDVALKVNSTVGLATRLGRFRVSNASLLAGAVSRWLWSFNARAPCIYVTCVVGVLADVGAGDGH